MSPDDDWVAMMREKLGGDLELPEPQIRTFIMGMSEECPKNTVDGRHGSCGNVAAMATLVTPTLPPLGVEVTFTQCVHCGCALLGVGPFNNRDVFQFELEGAEVDEHDHANDTQDPGPPL